MVENELEQQGKEVVAAGDVSQVKRFVSANPHLATYLLPSATLPIANQDSIVKILLAAGADPNARGGGGDTALHNAATFNDRVTAKLLLDAGADVNIAGGFHYNKGTPLSYAAGFGYPDMVALLIDHGATIYNAFIAAAAGRLDLLTSYILPDGTIRAAADAGPPETAEGVAGDALLEDPQRFLQWWFCIACTHNQVEVVQYLLRYDFDLNKVMRVEYQGPDWTHIEPENHMREVDGTPLRHAVLREYDELALLLRQRGAQDKGRDD